MSEKADTRYWSSLPLDFQVSSHRLPKGEYTLLLKDELGNEKELSKFKVDSLKSSVLVKERLITPVSSIKK